MSAESAQPTESDRARHVHLGTDAAPPADQQKSSDYRGTAREGWCHHPTCHNHVTQTSGTAGARAENSQEYGHDPDCPYYIHK